jgi:hypothetical protein
MRLAVQIEIFGQVIEGYLYEYGSFDNYGASVLVLNKNKAVLSIDKNRRDAENALEILTSNNVLNYIQQNSTYELTSDIEAIRDFFG